jgi:hypothetical protein
MYNRAIKIFIGSLEIIGEKIILARSKKRIKKEFRAPSYHEYINNPSKYVGRIFF